MILVRACALALAILAISMGSSALLRWLAPNVVAEHPWLEQMVLKTLLAGLSLLAIRTLNRTGLRGAGFVRAAKVRWLGVWPAPMAMGAAASLLILGAGSRGLSGVFGSYGFLGIVFWIWFYSSVTEEIFTRGWFQTYVAERDSSHAVLASALLFGAMHLTLLLRVDPIAVCVIVLSAFTMGHFAGRLRERYGSLVPAIVAHISFNAGGMVGGVIFTIAYRIVTGHLPVQ